DTLVKGILRCRVAGFIAVPHDKGLSTTVKIAGFFTQTEKLFIGTQDFVSRDVARIRDVPTVLIVTHQQFLILVEHLYLERSLVDTDTKACCKYLKSLRTIFHKRIIHILEILTDHGKRFVIAFELAGWRVPHLHHILANESYKNPAVIITTEYNVSSLPFI